MSELTKTKKKTVLFSCIDPLVLLQHQSQLDIPAVEDTVLFITSAISASLLKHNKSHDVPLETLLSSCPLWVKIYVVMFQKSINENLQIYL